MEKDIKEMVSPGVVFSKIIVQGVRDHQERAIHPVPFIHAEHLWAVKEGWDILKAPYIGIVPNVMEVIVLEWVADGVGVYQ